MNPTLSRKGTVVSVTSAWVTVRRFLFMSFGHMNMLTFCSVFLSGIGISSLAGHVPAVWGAIIVVTAYVTLLGTLMYLFMEMYRLSPHPAEAQRKVMDGIGIARPLRITKDHPERVEAFRNLAAAMGLSDKEAGTHEGYKNLGWLILMGKIEPADVHLAINALRVSNGSRKGIRETVMNMKQNVPSPFVGGVL